MLLKNCYKKVLTGFLFFISLLIISISCDSTEPTDELKPGRRDYTWTVDTLKPPEGRSLPSKMWGANANDVWTVGLSYLNAYCIWHFDGNSWNNYTPDKYIDPTCIWGTSNNNIWIGSSDGAFWRYDGVKWNRFSETVIPNYQQFVIQSICGNSPSNIYVVGFADSIAGNFYKAAIMHFNGSKWELVNIPTIKESFKRIIYDNISNTFLICSWVFNQPDEYIYNFDGNSLKKIYSSKEHLTLTNIGNKIFLSENKKLLEYKNESFGLFLDFTSTDYVGNAYGRTEMDFFTINWNGIGHYNGTDLVTIYPKWNNDWGPGGGIVFEKDVFFIWDDSYNTFIVHGKLN
jgi:hypothetical protein